MYAEHATLGADETAPLLPAHGSDRADRDVYGEAKVACEQIVTGAFGQGRSVLARAGLIGGPGDPSGRLRPSRPAPCPSRGSTGGGRPHRSAGAGRPGLARRPRGAAWAGPRSLPLWLPMPMPMPMPEYAGFGSRSCAAAVAAGLRCRPLADTLADGLARALRQEADHPLRAGLTPGEERELLETARTSGA